MCVCVWVCMRACARAYLRMNMQEMLSSCIQCLLFSVHLPLPATDATNQQREENYGLAVHRLAIRVFVKRWCEVPVCMCFQSMALTAVLTIWPSSYKTPWPLVAVTHGDGPSQAQLSSQEAAARNSARVVIPRTFRLYEPSTRLRLDEYPVRHILMKQPVRILFFQSCSMKFQHGNILLLVLCICVEKIMHNFCRKNLFSGSLAVYEEISGHFHHIQVAPPNSRKKLPPDSDMAHLIF